MIVYVTMCMVGVWKPQGVRWYILVFRDLRRQLGVPVHREQMLEDPRSHTLPATSSSLAALGAYVPKR